ncbi:MAG: DNA adenine methylase [Muribaculaceae bacterium]|nr:DNA adenine methylase [Muribaculaceae bacterium]
METKTTGKGWSGNYERVFSASKEMFTINPFTGKAEMKSGKGNWETLVDIMVKAARGIDVRKAIRETFNPENAASGLRYLIPYMGGKTNELKYIYPNLPSYDRYFEPFVGGGSVFMGINANEYFINDFSSDLITLYRNIAFQNKEFYHYADLIDTTIKNAIQFSNKYYDNFFNFYDRYKEGLLIADNLRYEISSFCDIHKCEILDIMQAFSSLPCILPQEMDRFLYKTLVDMKKIKCMTERKVAEYFLTAIQKALYTNYRNLFNNKKLKETNPVLYSCVFLYIREFTYKNGSSYNSKGEYNSTYGGVRNNSKLLSNNIEYYTSKSVIEHFKKTCFYNLDFEDFLRKTSPTENDFIFLDPPYDETVSTYHGNEFSKTDHHRLANFLLNECKAKWMMIIKRTDFIFNLYNKEGITIQSYEKKYTYTNKTVIPTIHLLITNYSPKSETYRMAA